MLDVHRNHKAYHGMNVSAINVQMCHLGHSAPLLETGAAAVSK